MNENLNMPSAFKRFREKFGLSKSDVSNALEIKLTSYDYEKQSKSSNPTVKTLFKLAKAYNVSLDYLAGLTDDPRPVNQILAESASKQADEKLPAEYVTQAELTELRQNQQNQINDLKARVSKLENS